MHVFASFSIEIQVCALRIGTRYKDFQVFLRQHNQLKFERNLSRFRRDAFSNGFVYVLLIERIMIEKFTVELDVRFHFSAKRTATLDAISLWDARRREWNEVAHAIQ